jgi:hypothetical protein
LVIEILGYRKDLSVLNLITVLSFTAPSINLSVNCHTAPMFICTLECKTVSTAFLACCPAKIDVLFEMNFTNRSAQLSNCGSAKQFINWESAKSWLIWSPDDYLSVPKWCSWLALNS